jgi:hypothetical protein
MAFKIKNARDKANQWVRGESLKLINNDLEPVDITINATYDQGQRWFSIPKSSFKMSPGATEEITFLANIPGISFGKRDNTVFYNSALTITVKRADGTSETKSFKHALKVAHPKSFDGF